MNTENTIQVTHVVVRRAEASRAKRPLATSLGARLCLLSFAFALFLLSGTYDPDFEAYRFIYELGWGVAADGSRDPLFIFVVESLRGVFHYEQFRFALCVIFSIALFRLAPQLGAMSVTKRFGIAQALVLAPFILLKLHVQIREGVALLLWLFAVTNNAGNMSRNVRSRSFWIAALASSAIHLSVVMWWVSALILGSKRPQYRHQALTTFLLFAVYGAVTTAVGSRLLVEIFGGVFFVDSGIYVEVTPMKLAYWSFFVLLPLLALAVFNKNSLSVRGVSPWHPSIFGMTGTYGLLGFFSVSMLGMYLWGATDTDFNLTIRVAIALLMFLVIQLALTCPRRMLTWVAFVFSFLTVARLLFFPE